jgi:hypothetical protein
LEELEELGTKVTIFKAIGWMIWGGWKTVYCCLMLLSRKKEGKEGGRNSLVQFKKRVDA